MYIIYIYMYIYICICKASASPVHRWKNTKRAWLISSGGSTCGTSGSKGIHQVPSVASNMSLLGRPQRILWPTQIHTFHFSLPAAIYYLWWIDLELLVWSLFQFLNWLFDHDKAPILTMFLGYHQSTFPWSFPTFQVDVSPTRSGSSSHACTRTHARENARVSE